MNDGLLIVLSGFSGTGKGTIVKKVMSRYPDRYALSVSATTRAPRAGEEHGRDYFFCSDERFREMIAQGELLEYAGFVGNFYGTPRAYVEEQLSAGKNVILEIECNGAMQIRRAMPGSVLVFVLPPSAEELEHRLRKRGTETEETILRRLSRAFEEVTYIPSFDYIIINDDLEEAVNAFTAIADTVRRKTSNNAVWIDKIGADLEKYSRKE